jgi:hypothetical protein
MKTAGRVLLLVTALWLGLAGCGGSSSSSGSPGGSQPVPQVCSGISIKGAMVDSLTKQPVAQGWAVLESGTQLLATAVFNFAPLQRVSAGTKGDFELCVTTLSSPSAVVLVALDSAGKAYPPFVSAVSGATDLAIIAMGGCTAICGFEGSQQTTASVVVTGTITSAPISKTVSVTPQYAMTALDGSKSTQGVPNLWSIAMPSLDAALTNTFSTVPGTCGGIASYCTVYTFTLPSQNPFHPATVSGIPGTIQQAGAPIYIFNATVEGTASCIPPFNFTTMQQDGKSLLIGNPGAQLTAMTMSFTQCQ